MPELISPNLLLLRRERFLLDDGLDFRPTRARFAHDRARSPYGIARARPSEASSPHSAQMESQQTARSSPAGSAAHRRKAPAHFHSPRSLARAHWMACPVPRCSFCSTNCTPVAATAARTRSASWPITTKMSLRRHHLRWPRAITWPAAACRRSRAAPWAASTSAGCLCRRP